jgi:hypothetical protein
MVRFDVCLYRTHHTPQSDISDAEFYAALERTKSVDVTKLDYQDEGVELDAAQEVLAALRHEGRRRNRQHKPSASLHRQAQAIDPEHLEQRFDDGNGNDDDDDDGGGGDDGNFGEHYEEGDEFEEEGSDDDARASPINTSSGGTRHVANVDHVRIGSFGGQASRLADTNHDDDEGTSDVYIDTGLKTPKLPKALKNKHYYIAPDRMASHCLSHVDCCWATRACDRKEVDLVADMALGLAATKCPGCGVTVQSTDPKQIGYRPKRAVSSNKKMRLCKRCYCLRHYNRVVCTAGTSLGLAVSCLERG